MGGASAPCRASAIRAHATYKILNELITILESTVVYTIYNREIATLKTLVWGSLTPIMIMQDIQVIVQDADILYQGHTLGNSIIIIMPIHIINQLTHYI